MGAELASPFTGPVASFDVRNNPPPLFDGRPPEDLDDPSSKQLLTQLEAADGIMWGLTAYWGGLSGVSKNMFDVIGGGVYDGGPVLTPIDGKPAAIIVVGTDHESAAAAAAGATRALELLGSTVVAPPVVIGNPRTTDLASGDSLEQLIDGYAALVTTQLAAETTS